jgi:hypothetical protein
MMFENGHLTHADVIKFCEGFEYPKVFDKLSIDENGLYYNRRLDKEIAKRAKSYDSKLKNLATYIKEPPLKGKGKVAESPINGENSLPDAPSTQNAGDIPKEKASRAVVFKPPTVDEVAAYCKERNNSIDPIAFLNHYEAVGWRYGKGPGKPIKDWKACVRTWEDKRKKELQTKGIDRGQRIGQIIVDGSIAPKFKTD